MNPRSLTSTPQNLNSTNALAILTSSNAPKTLKCTNSPKNVNFANAPKIPEMTEYYVWCNLIQFCKHVMTCPKIIRFDTILQTCLDVS